MRIGVDIWGGDYAPEKTVLGSILACKELSNEIKLVLIGDKDQIFSVSKKYDFDANQFEIVHTPEHISMGEHPAKAFAQKPNSSIVLGFGMLAQGKLNAFASAGNTGAMLVGAVQVIKPIEGIIRPGISALVPRLKKKPTILLDVGINPDCKPEVLYQYAILGSLYSKHVFKIDSPRVGLLNIGEEEGKGNLLTKAAHQSMKGSKDFNFIGNIEGTQIYSDDADVIVCDGFVGNVILKQAESFYSLLKKRNITDEYFELFNFELYGGTPVLGVSAPVIIGHGISNETAIKNMIIQAAEVAQANLPEKIKELLSNV